MPRILIAGCGYVGAATAKLFLDHAWDVTAWTLSGEIADRDLSMARRAVDLRQLDEVRRNSFECDAVVHCASSRGGEAREYRRLYFDGVSNLAESFPRARLIFTSSTTVYAQRDGTWVDENSPAEPASEKGKILRAAEEIVLTKEGIVLRLAGIYGPGRSFLLQSVMNGTASISDAEARYVNQIHRDDVASAICLVAGTRTIRAPRILNVVDNAPVPRREILNWLSLQLGKPLPESRGAVERKRGDSNKRVRNDRLRELGWSALYPTFQEGFQHSVLSAINSL
jgi:nucleoside-diphosphate-sugar epimerase